MDKCIFDNDNSFKKCIYQYFCQCKDQCIELNKDYFNDKKPNKICNEIIVDHDINDYLMLIKLAIQYFINKKLIKYKDSYYIKGKKYLLKLTWNNIKTIKYKKKKELFWLFRKIVIDSIIKHIIKHHKFKHLKVFSVGSSNLNSDYDITLYGEDDDKIKLIDEFNSIFNLYFNENSSILFDTNIYGKSYITFNKKEYESNTTMINNCGEKFYYLNSNPEPYSQLLWGIVKYIKDIHDGFEEHMYEYIYSYIKSTVETETNTIITDANDVLIYLNNQPDYVEYNFILQHFKPFIKQYKHKLNGIHDYLSILNFYGNETYFTRGPFLDVVINNQTCKKDIIPLDEIDYVTSILENAGFYFVHNKVKYMIRVYHSLQRLLTFSDYDNRLNQSHSYSSFIKIINNSNINKKEYKYCKSLSTEDDIDILSCQHYELKTILLNISCKIIKIYTDKNKNYNLKTTPIFKFNLLENMTKL
jgi:hypothetical protein